MIMSHTKYSCIVSGVFAHDIPDQGLSYCAVNIDRTCPSEFVH